MLLSGFFFSLLITAGPLDEVRNNLKDRKSFEVEFTQEVTQELFPDDPNLAKGTVKFTRPDLLRWVYVTPEKKEILYDGTKLEVVTESGRQEIPETDTVSLQESFAFLWGESSGEHFSVVNMSDKQFKLLPKNPRKASFKSIVVSVDKALVQEAKVTDLLDGESLLRFKAWKFQ